MKTLLIGLMVLGAFSSSKVLAQHIHFYKTDAGGLVAADENGRLVDQRGGKWVVVAPGRIRDNGTRWHYDDGRAQPYEESIKTSRKHSQKYKANFKLQGEETIKLLLTGKDDVKHSIVIDCSGEKNEKRPIIRLGGHKSRGYQFQLTCESLISRIKSKRLKRVTVTLNRTIKRAIIQKED
jgi:hypothetical protein